jgi:hypothetical protein
VKCARLCSSSLYPWESSIAIVDPAKPIKVIEPARIGGKSLKQSARIKEVRAELGGRLHPRTLFKVGNRILLDSVRLPEAEEVTYEDVSPFTGRDTEARPFKFAFYVPDLLFDSLTYYFSQSTKLIWQSRSAG